MTNKFKDVFISYGRRESLGFVGRLHQQLKLAGYDGWFDKINIPDGDDYAQRINHGIESAHNFIYLMAPRCLTSPYCLIELEYARLLGKRVIPINHQVIFQTPSQKLSDGDKQVMSGFYQRYNLPDQNIQTTQDVLNRSLAVVGSTDWLAGQEKLSDEDGDNLFAWAQTYENHWAKHDDLNYLKSFDFPRFGEPIDTLESVVERLLVVIERQQDYVHKHTDILADALHWQQNQKATQHLLVGKERTVAEEWLLTKFSADKQPPCKPSALVCEFICEARKNAENMMTDIFICYDTKDKEIRDHVIQSISRYAKTTWTHDRDIQKGVDYERAIEQGIENADNLFYFISPHAVVSEYCQKELAHAFKYNKRIVPLLIVPTLESDIPEVLRGLQYVDFTDNTCQADYDSDIDDILNILRHEHEYYEQHKVLLARALKWQNENYKPSFLLRGHNLDNAKTWLRLNDKRDLHPPTELHHKLITASEAAKGQLGTEVFVSYSRKDADFARLMNTALQEAGKTTWFDQESLSSGVDFEQEIFKGIDGADNFLFVLSPDAVQSEYCEREINYANEQNKRVISVLHRETEPTIMPESLRVINWIDFKDTAFDKSFSELIQAIELEREYTHLHTVLQQRASDWAENNRSGDFLLNITACNNAESWLDIALAKNKQPMPTQLQQDFIHKSRRAIQQANRRRKMLFSCIPLALVAFIFAGFAFVQMNVAKDAQTEAEISADKAKEAKVKAERLYKKIFKTTGLTKEEAKEAAQQFIKEKGERVFHDSLKDGSEGPEMVWLPAGQFQMGNVSGRGHQNEKPVHKVSIKRFALGRFEVTVGEFQQFVEATGYQTEAETERSCKVYKDGYWQYVTDANWRNPYFVQADDQPVVCVSWNDTEAYTQWLSEQTGQTYRLPSEAEWEYAARAGKELPYWWGNDIGEDWGVCNGCGSQWDNRQTAPVVSLLPNLFGLYHITGNVWEWVADPWHNNYEGAPNNGHVWEKEGVRCRRVSRGGGWQSEPKNVRLAYRNGSMNLGDSLDFRSASRGFRLARQEKPLTKTEVEAKQKQPDEIKLQPCQFRVFRHRLKDGSEGPEMVQLPAGTFQMGDIQGNDDEKPVHEVSVARFAMGRYEVTFAEYDKFAEATGRKNPPDENWGRGNLPVINISWHDAVAYAEWLSKQTGQDYRLPTEAQWEYAARAGTETTYWWGNNISNQASCKQCGNFKSTVSVGSFGANPFKLYDTVGNVWEWTCSEYEKSYSGKESQNISPNEGNDSIEIVIRGGSWFDGRWRVRAAIRSKLKPNIRLKTVGFRLVRM